MMNLTPFQSSRPVRAMLLVAAVALGAALAQMAVAAPQEGHGPGGHGERGGHRAMMGAEGGMKASPRHMERLLDDVKATPEQRAQIKQITDAAHTEMAALRESGRKLHEQDRAHFAQPNVDARGAETLRQQKLAHHDQVSKRMLQMRLDISRVLTPEQRAQMNERMQKRMGMMQRHHQDRSAADRPRS